MNYEAMLMYLIGIVESCASMLSGPISESQRVKIASQLEQSLNIIAGMKVKKG